MPGPRLTRSPDVVRYADEAGEHVLELQLSKPDAQRGTLYERTAVYPELTRLGTGYSRTSVENMARRYGLELVDNGRAV